MAAASTPPTQDQQPPQQWTVIERGGYRYPPGLSLNLLFYLRRRFFKPSNPILLFEHLAATYGRIAHYKLGWQHIVFINHPDFIREVLVNHPQEMIKERTQRRMKILLGEGLITSEGAFHMRQRRIAAPAFHRQRIAAYADVMIERAALRRAGWHAGQTLDIGAEMMQLALEVVARTLFNTDVTSDVLEINHEVNVIMDLYNYLISLPLAEAYLYAPLPGLTRFRRARARLDAVVHRIIADHRSRARARRRRGQRRPALHADGLTRRRGRRVRKNGMTDEQLRDEIITIFLAGYETVANALTWTWLLLAQNPEAAKRFLRRN